MSDLVYLNGEFVRRPEARISAFDRGFLYGDGLFETMRIVRSAPFLLERHMERMNASCHALGWHMAPADDRLRRAIGELIGRNAIVNGYLRITASRGPHEGKLTDLAATNPTVLVDAHAMELPPIGSPPDWALALSPHHVEATSPVVRHKTLSYQAHLLALAEGRRAGADEVCFVNSDGHLAEGAITNLFFVRSGVVCTPDVACGLLPGVMRGVVLELCARLGFPARTGRYAVQELAEADEAFCTNSLRGVVRVDRFIGPPDSQYGPAPTTRALQAAYAELVDGGQ